MTPHPIESDPAWRRMCKQAMREAESDLARIPRRMLDPGNPNHPDYDRLFGYDRDQFLAMQYR